MKFIIDKAVFEKFPNLVVAIPIIFGFDNHKSVDEAVKYLRDAESNLKNKYNIDQFNKLDNVTAYENCFTGFGTDPKVFLPAHVALSKRVLEGGNIPNINPLVNLYNGFSIANTIPFGGEDLEKVYGNFKLFIAQGGEKWIPIGSKKSNDAVKEELVWGDDLDLSTRALNWRQCDRTKLTSESKNGYFIMDGFKGVNDELIRKSAELFSKKVVELFGGKSQILWLDQNNPEAELDFKSKNIEEIVEIKKEKIKIEKKYYFLAKRINDLVKSPVEHPTVEKFGDYAVRGDFDFKNLDIVAKVDKVAGFSNIWLKTKTLVEEAKNILSNEYKKDLAKIGGGKKVIVEYSSPNIAKSFGIGHLRSTNIGQAIYNIHQILGWETIGDNHLGDWGTQFGKMICAIKKAMIYDLRFKIYESENIKIVPEKMSISDLEKLYVAFHKASETDETLMTEAREWFAKLENGDQEAREIWQKCVDISLAEFNRVYDLLGVKIDNAHGEAFFENMLPQVVEDLKKAGLTKVSNGALIVEFSDMSPAILLKSDGATTYFTRDLATIKYRVNKWKPDKVVYEVGSEQILHFRQVFRAAEMMGWVIPGSLYHLPHGLLRWSSGKFSTRSGDTIHLADVIEKAMTEAKKIAPENSEEAIKAVAIGAIKFNDLASDPRKDVVFDWERVMSMEGSSGPYLQYTYARCKSVLAKSKLLTSNFPAGGLPDGRQLLSEKFDEEEKPLLRYFYIFNEKIVEAGERMSPAVIAEYLLSLARKYNEFYAKCRIVGEPEEERRLFLTQVTAKIIKDGLSILGIETLEKM